MTAFLRRLGRRVVAGFRDPNPILVKELRTTFRAKLFIRFFYLSILGLAFIVLTGSAMVSTGGVPPAQVGGIVFQVFFSLVLGIVLLVGCAHSATTLSGEREGRTLDTLMLSGMDPRRIIWGKFLASYAMLTLVLVGLAPVVGIAFLFGGVSPFHIFWGYFGVALWLAVAVSFGVAISSRVRKTRVAILLSGLLFGPSAFTAVGIQTALQEVADRPWGLRMEGPFWFVEALSERFFELDTFALVFLLPLFLTAMTTWFFLATASSALRPASHDRSTIFKLWSIFCLLSILGIGGALVQLLEPHDVDDAVVVFALLSAFPASLFALLFMDEPPLPAIERSPSRFPRLRRLLGPGAAPTLRFAGGLLAFATLASATILIGCNHLLVPGGGNEDADAAVLVGLMGNLAVFGAFVGVGSYARIWLKSGMLARIIAAGAFVAAILLPALLSTIIEPDAWDDLDDRIPILLALSPLLPTMLAAGIYDSGDLHRVIELAFVTPYAVVALATWVAVERRVISIRRGTELRRRKRDERIEARAAARREQTGPVELVVRESSPPGELVVRASTPPPAEEEGAHAQTSAGQSAPPLEHPMTDPPEDPHQEDPGEPK